MLIGVMGLVMMVNLTGILDDEGPMPPAYRRAKRSAFDLGLGTLRRSTDD